MSRQDQTGHQDQVSREYHTVSIFITRKLRDEVKAMRPAGMLTKDFYTSIAADYMRAVEARAVPRAFVPKDDATQTTLELRQDVYASIRALADSMNETVSTLMRTACALHVYQSRTFDPHDSYELDGPAAERFGGGAQISA